MRHPLTKRQILMLTRFRGFIHQDVGTPPLLLLGFISTTICIVEFYDLSVDYPLSYLLGVMFFLSTVSLVYIGSVIDKSYKEIRRKYGES
jgi:hypothetical protein